MGVLSNMIVKKKWFTYQETTNPKIVTIVPNNYDDFPFNTKNGGSYAVAPARVLGFSYPDYLRFLMIMFPNDVEIVGKGKLFPIVYWKRDKTLYTFLQLLNAKLSLAIGAAENE